MCEGFKVWQNFRKYIEISTEEISTHVKMEFFKNKMFFHISPYYCEII